ncbi:MAG: putative sulfate exporter family transporter [Xanthomonadales bacterium]|nr:putative sulfate exporter family transporter [Xanthomonadales bacterium]
MNRLPGLALALVLAVAGILLAAGVGKILPGFPRSPLSPVLLAILLGVLVRNTVGLRAVFEPGVAFGLTRILKLGIVLLGLRLGLSEVGEIGLEALPVIVACVVCALLLVTWIGSRVGVSARLGTLIAVGTAICGSTAIAALSPAIRARQDETAYAIACITLFGMVAMLAYPWLSWQLFANDALQAGVFLGTAIHDTAQVIGAGILYEELFGQPEALDGATVTKLVRNLGMLVVIPLLGALYHRRAGEDGTENRPWYRMIPLFVIGFAGMSALRTVGDLGDRPLGMLTPAQWDAGLAFASGFAQLCLGVAMASVGLSTRLAGIRSLGLRPLAVGLFSALLVGGLSAVLVGWWV